jgi:SanA protein
MSVAKILRKLIGFGVVVSILAVAFVFSANAYIIAMAGPIKSEPAALTATDVVLVLGTSHWSADGHPNRHFAGRMDATAELYHAGLVRHILASGANPEIYYNEPQRMLEALQQRGVPSEVITLDYAGRRTLDSIIRAREVFGQKAITIVSQPYHLYRALYLARAMGMSAQGYAASQPPLSERWRIELREVMARVLAVLDVEVLKTEAGVLGDPEPIVMDAAPL